MYNRRDLTDEELIGLLPHVMGTQHPDNVSKVPFGPGPEVDRHLEEEEVLYNVTVLGLPELMIDYEKKQGGCTPLWDWLHRCPTCLEEKVIGRDFHVTPRIPNGDTDRDDPYFWQSMGIFVNSLLVMKQMGLPWLPFSEFIVPDASRGARVAEVERDIADLFKLQREQYRHYGEGSPFPYEGKFFVQGIPLIETVEDLLDPEPIWDELVDRRRELTGEQTYVQRSFIARSDPALKAGLVPALLAAVVALHRGRQYERRTGIQVPQILGIGSAPFRGGLTPEDRSIQAVLATYPGTATVTVQSAFRYDHPEEQVIRASRQLGEELGSGYLARHDLGPGPGREEVEELRGLIGHLKQAYEASYRELLPLISRVAKAVPRRRERYTNIDVAGEARRVGGLPAVRAIQYAASCYTLGVPPGVLGFRAWEGLSDRQRALAEATCPQLRHWLREELRFLNPDNARRLPGEEGLPLLARDLEAALAWAGDFAVDDAHAEQTTRAAAALEGRGDLGEALLAAAAVRKFLG